MHTRPLRLIPGLLAALPAVSVSPAQTNALLEWQGTIEVAVGRGVKGPWQQNESRYDYVDDPTVAIDNRGEITVGWVDQGRKDVFLQRYAADGAEHLRAPVNVSRNPATFSWLPRIALAPDAPRRVFVLWQEIIFSGGSHGGDILFARSHDGGATFSQPVNLSDSMAGDGKGRISRDYWHNGSLDIVAGDDGTLYVAWTEYEGRLWLRRSSDGGRSFSPPQQVAGGAGALPARVPSLALGAGGTLYLAWTVGEDDAADIRVATSTDGGATFAAPRVVAPSDGYSDAPKIAVGPNGILHLAYGESAGGPIDAYRVRYTRSADGARTFEPAREISDPLPVGVEGAGFPALSLDANGNVYVLWELFPDPRGYPRGLGVGVSLDAGRTYRSMVVPHSLDPAGGTNGSHQGLLMKKLDVNDAGAVAIVNSSLELDERSRVWLIRAEGAAAESGR